MNESSSPRWFPTALLAGAAYFLIGELFALPATHVQLWRLAAWGASVLVYAAHIGHEYFRRRNSPRSAAVHVAAGVAIGAFGLALYATVHSRLVGSAVPLPQYLLALVLWPAITAVPAFLVSYLGLALLRRLLPRA